MAGDATTVGAVRSAIRHLLRDEPPETCDVAVLLTDELVTNAVVHGGGRYRLTAEVLPGTLEVTVSDRSGDQPPRVLAAGTEEEHGRGMAIMAALATEWGSRREDGGKAVWFRLDLRS